MVSKAKKNRGAKRAATKTARKAPSRSSRPARTSGLRRHNPPSIAPGSNYTHGIEVPPGARLLGIAGQVGRDVNGHVPDGIEAQATLAWANVKAVLAEAGMEMSDIVHYFSILVRREDNDGYDKARVAALGDARPASTKIYVAGLARPEILCEVQVFAAKAGGSRRRGAR
jgi:enamine deaminase RidA (YjgF/YER057c/UK114 family)